MEENKMETIFWGSASRKRSAQEPENYNYLPKIETNNGLKNMNRIIVMQGSAKRKPPSKSPNKENCLIDIKEHLPKLNEFAKKASYREDFAKLQIPYRMTNYKKMTESSGPISKSCQVLFECLKPYHDLMKSKSTSVSIQKILPTSNFTDNPRATRKVQFFSFSEETPDAQPHLSNFNFLSSCEYNTTSDQEEFNFLNFTFEKKTNVSDLDYQAKIDLNCNSVNQKTISSEDFINNVVPAGEENTKINLK